MPLPNVYMRPVPRVSTTSDPHRAQMSFSLLTIASFAQILTESVDTRQAACTIACPGGLISVGLTSGLGSLACTVVAASGDSVERLHTEVLPGPRKDRDVSNFKRYRAHRLMFEILFERWPPGVIALGPPADPKEPIEWIVFMRTAMFELGKGINVPVLLYDSDAAIVQRLGGVGRVGLKTMIKRYCPTFSSNKPRNIRSTGTAIAGALQQFGFER